MLDIVFCRAFFLFFLLALNSFGLNLQDPKEYLVFTDEIEIFYDPNREFSIENIPLKEFAATNNRALGYQKGAIWSKLEVPKMAHGEWLYIIPKINLNSIDVYVYEDNLLLATYNLGNYHPPSQRAIPSKFSNFELNIKPNKSYTIISKIESKSPIDTTWIATKKDVFITYNIYDTLFWGVLIGFISSLLIYNFVTFLSLKDFTYVAYTFHALFALLFQLATNGIFYQFGLYENLKIFNSINWFIAQLNLASILYFAIYFLNTKRSMPFIHRITLLLFGGIFLMLLLFFYSFFNPEIINQVRFVAKIVSLSILSFTLVLVYYGIKKRILGARYYLIGHGFFIFAIIYQQFGGIINNEISLTSIYIVAVSILLDTLFLSLALSQKLTFLKYEKERNERLLISQSGFSAIGRTIGNLSHQWKIPISRLGTLVMQMEALIWKSTDKLKYELEDILRDIRLSLKFMQSSINEFNNFYSNSTQKKEFYLASEIDNIITILGAKILYSNATVEKNIDYKIKMFGYKSAFANTCLIIIDNALDIFKQRNIDNGVIKITLFEEKSNIVLTIQDSGGGVDITPIDKIFDVFVSGKEDGNGMGLAMVKVLLNERLGGEIKVKNLKDGALFTIRLLA